MHAVVTTDQPVKSHDMPRSHARCSVSRIN